MTALMEAVADATADVPRLYASNSVPDVPTYPYGAVSALWGRADGYSLDSTHGLRHARIIVQAFGRTVDSATDLAEDAIAALLDLRLPVVGFDCEPCRLELDPALVREPDAQGVIGVTTTLTFAATKES